MVKVKKVKGLDHTTDKSREVLNRFGYFEIIKDIFIIKDDHCWRIYKKPQAKLDSEGKINIDGVLFYPRYLHSILDVIIDDRMYSNLSEKETILQALDKLQDIKDELNASLDLFDKLSVGEV